MNNCIGFPDYDNNRGSLAILSTGYYSIYSCTRSSRLPSDEPVEYKTAQVIHPIAARQETNKGRSISHVICLLYLSVVAVAVAVMTFCLH